MIASAFGNSGTEGSPLAANVASAGTKIKR
jgi:hypothetical protein